MKVAIFSDIHDNIGNLQKAIEQVKGNVENVIFCGDMSAPFTAEILGGVGVPIFACLGNNDEDHIQMFKKGGDKFSWTGLAEEYGQVTLDNKKIAFCHYPKLAELLANSGEFDAVFFGHTHNAGLGDHGKTLLLNPGAICGIQNGKSGSATFAIYDTSSNDAEIVVVQ